MFLLIHSLRADVYRFHSLYCSICNKYPWPHPQSSRTLLPNKDMVTKNVCQIGVNWKSQKYRKLSHPSIYQSLIYPTKYPATINCIINVVALILKTKAVKKHMLLKSMSTNGSHWNSFFFVPITRYLHLEYSGALVFNYDCPKNSKDKCFLPVMASEYPLINDFLKIYFNSPKSQVICKSFYMTFHIITWSDLGNLNHISLGSYLVEPENNICRESCMSPNHRKLKFSMKVLSFTLKSFDFIEALFVHILFLGKR